MQQAHYCKDCKWYKLQANLSLCINPSIVGVSLVDGAPKSSLCGLIRIDTTCSGFNPIEVAIKKEIPSTTEHVRKKPTPPPIRKVTTFTWKSLFNFFKKD